MAKRKALSKSTRFEVFKRDSFTCQYCGQSAPSVVLHCDHIMPVAEGGTNDIVNLLTSCEACNSGKGARRLDDQSEVAKQKAQLDELNERRLQIEMLMQWKHGLRDVAKEAAKQAVAYFETSYDTSLNEKGKAEMAKLVKRFSLAEVIDAIEQATNVYSDAEKAFSKIGGICFIKKKSANDPDFAAVSRVRGALAAKKLYVNHADVDRIVRSGLSWGVEAETFIQLARNARSWTAWREDAVAEVNSQAERFKAEHPEQFEDAAQ